MNSIIRETYNKKVTSYQKLNYLLEYYIFKCSISRSSLVCSFSCLKSDDCSAFSFQKETQTCQLGVKGKSIPSLSATDVSTSIHKKPGPIYIIKGNVRGSKTISSNNFFGGGNFLEIIF
jgi:hypothetical protein